MDKFRAALIAAVAVYAGCSSSNLDTNSEQRASEHMTLARTLESDSSYSDAVLQYLIVAEHYPRTTYYQAAVHKAANLYGNPENPLASDSLALHWLRVYAGLQLSEEARDNTEARLRLIEKMTGLRQILAGRDSTIDSLAAVVKDQQSQLVTKSREMKDIERELSLTRQELEKLREIDIEVGRERGK